jgi:hypothetical protein
MITLPSTLTTVDQQHGYRSGGLRNGDSPATICWVYFRGDAEPSILEQGLAVNRRFISQLLVREWLTTADELLRTKLQSFVANCRAR